jgi:hypothetical protein
VPLIRPSGSSILGGGGGRRCSAVVVCCTVAPFTGPRTGTSEAPLPVPVRPLDSLAEQPAAVPFVDQALWTPRPAVPACRTRQGPLRRAQTLVQGANLPPTTRGGPKIVLTQTHAGHHHLITKNPRLHLHLHLSWPCITCGPACYSCSSCSMAHLSRSQKSPPITT